MLEYEKHMSEVKQRAEEKKTARPLQTPRKLTANQQEYRQHFEMQMRSRAGDPRERLKRAAAAWQVALTNLSVVYNREPLDEAKAREASCWAWCTPGLLRTAKPDKAAGVVPLRHSLRERLCQLETGCRERQIQLLQAYLRERDAAEEVQLAAETETQRWKKAVLSVQRQCIARGCRELQGADPVPRNQATREAILALAAIEVDEEVRQQTSLVAGPLQRADPGRPASPEAKATREEAP